jgi:hypothetical protein
MQRIRASMTVAALALSLAFVASSQAAWHQPVGGASPINSDPGTDAITSSLTSINGVPHIAWIEPGGGPNPDLLWVARLNAAGTDWEVLGDHRAAQLRNLSEISLAARGDVPYAAVAFRIADGAVSQFNVGVLRRNSAGTDFEFVGPTPYLDRVPSDYAYDPSLAMVGNVPYVAWYEDDGNNDEVRVAHLNEAGNGWVRDVDTTSPINIDGATQDATAPSIADVNGVPWVAWQEVASGGTQQNVNVRALNATGTAWVTMGAPVDKVASADAQAPSLTSINGVPWIAWSEQQGSSYQIRVARFEAGAWVRVADGVSPINRDPNAFAENPSLTSIGGVPWVAWHENTTTGSEIRVARLNAAGTAWERIADSASPINESSSKNANFPSLANVDGVPFVSWVEPDAANNGQARVSRLEPEFQSQSVTPGATTATASATWHTYGLQYPIGFDYGASLESSTLPTPAPVGQDTATVTQEITGLSPQSPYQLRSFALAPVAPRILALNSTVFNTTAVPPQPPAPAGGDTTSPETEIIKQPKNKLDASKAKYKFTSSEPGSTFVCKFDKAKAKPCDAGKAKFKHLDDGKHKFSVYAIDAAGNADPSAAKDKFKVL